MLIAAFIAFLYFSGAGFSGQEFIDVINNLAKESITEPDRKKEISSLADDMEKELKGYSKQLKGSSKRLTKLNRDYNSTREDMEKAINELNQSRISAQQNTLETLFKMKARITREEWNSVFKKE